MNPLEGLARIVEWCASNTAYNLQFIPDDRLNWKPAPTAKSALEIVNHVAHPLKGMTPVMRGDAWSVPPFEPATTLAQAQDLLRTSAADYAAALSQVSMEDLHRTVHLPFGDMPLVRAASLSVVEIAHHHGQIAYIQTLLGDTDDHFQPE